MSVNDLLQSARYVVDESGNRKAVLLDWPAWKEFLTLLDEFDDYLELKNPKIRDHIRKSYREYLEVKSRPAEELLAELRAGRGSKVKAKRRRT
jgi:hypothetical protein